MQRIKLEKDNGDHHGRVKLALFGFKSQSVVSIREIVNAIDHLPDAHLEGLDEIRYDPLREMQNLLSSLLKRSHLNRFQAEFVQVTRAVIIYEIPSASYFFHILYHEIGHHVYFRIIDSSLKKEWVRQIYPRSGHITKYASRNAAEDFAECYAFYILDPERLQNHSEKYWFLKEKVFKNFKAQRLELRI